MAKQKKKGVIFHPDRPIMKESEDRLGFGIIAENLSTSILNAGAREGFVIGIEGQWGCGKSSILNLLCARLHDADNTSVVKFAPWIVGSRDNLVSSLMTSLSAAIAEVESETHTPGQKKLKQGESLAEKFIKYGAKAGKFATPYAEAISLIPGAEIAGKTAKAFAKLDDKKPKPLSDMKDELTEALKELGHTFVVIVDDIDRLEPSENAEIMRLIRAVGDFPNVIYVLCYDKDILARGLQSALKIDDGEVYLQKIVQAGFSVPKPEDFDLRRWLTEECHNLYQTVTGDVLPEDQAERLRAVCDSQGEDIETPREINLVLNSLRLVFPPIAGKVDFSDLVWLHIIKIKNRKFYDWIETYMNNFAVVYKGEGSLSARGHKELAQRLIKCLDLTEEDDDDYTSAKSIFRLQEYLPGLGETEKKGKITDLVMNVKNILEFDMTKLEEARRLASPTHFRLYFAFAEPSGILNEATLAGIISKASAGTPPIEEFRNLVTQKRPQGGTMYEVLLDRLKRFDFGKLSADGVEAIIMAMTATIDDGLRNERDPGFFGYKSAPVNGRKILKKALDNMKPARRKAVLKEIFKNGESLGWLLGEILGDELFNHGITGNRKNTERQIFTLAEMNEFIPIMNKRLAGKDKDRIGKLPNPVGCLYRWQQSSNKGKTQMAEWVKTFSKTDAGFLKLMELCRGTSINSDIGVHHPLNKRELKLIYGSEQEALGRLEKLAKKSTNAAFKSKAKELLSVVADPLGD